MPKLMFPFLCCLVLSTLIGCRCDLSQHASSQDLLATPVQHLVLCWLKDPGNAEQRAELIRVSRSLGSIPGVYALRVGEVLPSKRALVDDSFDVGISMAFASVADMQNYLDHPQHLAAVKDILQPLVSKIVVYDFTE